MPTDELTQAHEDPRVMLAQRLQAHCQACMPMMQQLYERLVQLDSPTEDHTANLACLRMLAPALKSLGFSVVEVPTDEGPVHLLGRRQLSGDPDVPPIPILFAGHVDTCHEKSDAFTGFQVKDGRAHGPGVAGMKGGIIVMLMTLDALAAIGVLDALDMRVVINTDGELGSYSSKSIIEKTAKGAEVGLVFEPARPDGAIVGSRRATGRYIFDISGRSAHAGEGQLAGRSAILEASVLIQRIDALSDPARGVSFNCGVIEGGTRANVIPAHASLQVDARCDRAEDVSWIETKMKEIASQSVRGCMIELKGGMGRPPWPESFDSLQLYDIWLEAADDLGLGAIEMVHAGGGSDANVLHGVGVPVLDGLGAVGGEVHSQKEWVALDSLPERAALNALSILMWIHRRSEGIWSPGGAA